MNMHHLPVQQPYLADRFDLHGTPNPVGALLCCPTLSQLIYQRQSAVCELERRRNEGFRLGNREETRFSE
jgi:hypothetical protein